MGQGRNAVHHVVAERLHGNCRFLFYHRFGQFVGNRCEDEFGYLFLPFEKIIVATALFRDTAKQIYGVLIFTVD